MTIPIVQGVSVSQQAYQPSGATPYHYQQAPSQAAAATSSTNNAYAKPSGYNTNAVVVEEDQQSPPQRQFRDVFWAILFVAHLVAILALIAVGMSSLDLSAGSGYSQILVLVSVTGVTAVILSTAALSFMMKNTETLVQMALIFSVLSSLAIGVVGFMMGSILLGCVGLFSFLLGMCYAKMVWHRIPFAAANLRTGLTAVRANLGVVVLAYLMLALAFGWTMLWFLGVGSSLQANNLAVVFLLFVSYYWTHEVFQNIVHVSVAGVVGTWWFVTEEANSFCSKAVGDSFFRAVTYSFGSICLGSLLVAIVKALRSLEYYTRDNDDFQFLSCIIQCLLGCLESILEEINKWAYVYVGYVQSHLRRFRFCGPFAIVLFSTARFLL
jgi:Plasma-membrane choline transporter